MKTLIQNTILLVALAMSIADSQAQTTPTTASRAPSVPTSTSAITPRWTANP